MRRAVLAMMVLGLAASFAPARADEAPAKKQKSDSTKQQSKSEAYLGLAIEPIPAALSSQLPTLVPKGQGVMVAHVAKDSPAAKAGLKADDVLLTIDEQKVSSPEQLVRLVHGDKPGQEVAIGFVRAGKRESCKVKLGKREMANEEDQPRVFRLQPNKQFREFFEEQESKTGEKDWETFDSLKLSRLGTNRWRAEIDYRSDKGKKEHKSFEGTRHEIRKDVRAEKDLPAHEKRHLLRALNLHEPIFEFHLPPFDQMRSEFH